MKILFVLNTVIILVISYGAPNNSDDDSMAPKCGRIWRGALCAALLLLSPAASAAAVVPDGFRTGTSDVAQWQVPSTTLPASNSHNQSEINPDEKQRLRHPGITQIQYNRAINMRKNKLQKLDGKKKLSKRRFLTDLPTLQGDIAVHDPTLVYADGRWILYSTHNGMEERESDDLITWCRPAPDSSAFKYPGLVWANKWTKDPNEFWAPDASGPYNDGLYRLYYAVPGAQFSDGHTAAIGMATSATGRHGDWQDHGMVFSSNDNDPYNAIDPNLLVDGSGRWWLTFGSFQEGIFQVELDPKTGMRKHGSELAHIARGPNGDGEAPFIYQKGDFYYLFISWGLCCMGVDSTYSIHYGRSKSPQGPFLDRNQRPMLSGYGSFLYGTNGNEVGPGGQSVVRIGSRDLLVYHFYDRSQNGASTLGLKYLDWDSDGWPYLI